MGGWGGCSEKIWMGKGGGGNEKGRGRRREKWRGRRGLGLINRP